MSKKIIIIIPIILGVLLLGLVGYYFLVQNNQSSPGTTSGFKGFFPFGGNSGTGETPTNVSSTTTSTPALAPSGQVNFNVKLRELSVEPVSGAGIVDIKAGSIVRYIEKATGHIFEVELFSPNKNRISNTTIPLVYDAIWGNKNASLVTRYLRDDNQTVDTYSLIIKDVSTTTEHSVSGIIFPNNISDVSVSNSSLFYLQQSSISSAGFVSNFSGNSKKQIWNSPIKELLSQFVNDKTVALTTKPAQNIPGFLYFVDTGSGQVKKILGDTLGLSTLTSPDANQVLYIEQGNGVVMFILDVKSKISKNITPATFPEKCVWSKKDKNVVYCAVPREYLDGGSLISWYKGLIWFSDDIWKYDIKNNTSNIVENLSDGSGMTTDVIKPILSESEQYIIFMNKIDNTLWSLDLTK